MMYTTQDNAFGILMYHRIMPPMEGVAPPTWNVEPRHFHRQLSGLLARGYRAWPLRRVLACRRSGERIPARTFVVTFDDGYENVYHHAWPVLRELSIPATVFVVTSYLDAERPFASDDWSAAGSAGVPDTAWKPLSTKHCAEMMEHGLIEIGSHTHTHADFRGHCGEFRGDLAESLHVLNAALGIEQPSFAFPFGYCDGAMKQAVRESGAACALTAEQSLVPSQADPYAWGRFLVRDGDTPTTLAWKLRGWFTPFNNVWHKLHQTYDAGRALFSRPYNRHNNPIV
jgi:peptidoglycan/xylan/chitin deacetylase (PgdA/CDA1 family)